MWRAKKNKISKLKDGKGNWVSRTDELEAMATSYFQELFSHDPNLNPEDIVRLFEPKVSDDLNASLCREFTNKEISDALFEIVPLKAPGSDGFPARFYQRNWGIMNHDVIAAVKLFFSIEQMPPSINHTAIVLIPKVDQPTSLKEFRPICLCTVLYKVIAKCLANRLRPLLGEIISVNQSAFVPGRIITDNALASFECFHFIEHNTNPGKNFYAYKIDLSKAYDRVDWGFLESAMKGLGFSHRWISWIKSCVTTVSYSVKLNGTLLDSFSPSRGLRRGDPLSPFLFLFVADGLSALIQKEIADNQIEPLKVCRRAPGISHMLFADDTLLFLKADAEQAARVQHVINKYVQGTGQLVNYDKCTLMFGKACPVETQEAIKAVLQVTQAEFEPKYLGLPTPEGRMNRGKFQSIQEKMLKRLVQWAEYSHGGKEILIKAVAQPIPTFLMGVFKLPAGLCEDFTKMIRQFWWGASPGHRRTHWVSWDCMLRRKAQGGMGFHDMKLFNQALLAKQAFGGSLKILIAFVHKFSKRSIT